MLPADRLLDLLTARATEGLSTQEAEELECALEEQRDLGDDLELAAAAVHLAFEADAPPAEAMPESIKRRILGTN
jgi:hypothetical protein